MNIRNVGGRQFLQETNRLYGLIVLDAYRKDTVPFERTTVEFAELADGHLSDDGVPFANLVSAPAGPASKFYQAEYRAMAQVFPRLYSFPTARETVIRNIEIVAPKNAAGPTQEAADPETARDRRS